MRERRLRDCVEAMVRTSLPYQRTPHPHPAHSAGHWPADGDVGGRTPQAVSASGCLSQAAHEGGEEEEQCVQVAS